MHEKLSLTFFFLSLPANKSKNNKPGHVFLKSYTYRTVQLAIANFHLKLHDDNVPFSVTIDTYVKVK